MTEFKEKKEGHFRRLGLKLEYGSPDEPASIIMAIDRKDGKGIAIREFIPEDAMQFAYDLGTKTESDPKTAGIAIEREDGEIEIVALPPEGAIQLAQDLMKMAFKAKELNEEKGFYLKDEYKGKKSFIYKDVKKGTYK
jgi:hypothetical protein